jgi:hypothetical protein
MLGFMGFRNSVSHRVAEFRWPMGRELSSSVRRMTMSEFCIALELAADLVDSMRGQLRGDDSSVYIKELDVQRELYENKLRKISEENEAQLALMEEKYAIVNDDNLRMKTVLNGTSGTIDITVDKLDEQRCMLEGQARSLENLTSTLSILGNKNNSDNSASLHSLETKISELIKKVDTLFVKPNEQTPLHDIKEETVEITPEEKVVEVKVSKKNKWQLHVEEIQRANNIPLKEAMVLAKETYKKDN